MMFERSQRKDKSNYGASFDNENEPMGDLFVTPQISKEAVKLTNAKLADPELAQTKDPEPDPDPELETSDFHQYLKQVSGKNVLKIPITPKNMKQPIKGYKVEGAVSLSVISGKRTNTKEEFKAFDLNQHPEIRSQLNTQKGDIAGVIKTASVDFAKKNWKVSSEGSYGKLFLSLKLLLDGPQLSLSEEEQKITPLSLQIMAVGRLENPDGVTADVYGTLSISPTEETTIKKVRQIYNAATPTKKKIAKGELLRKKMLEIGKEEQKAAKKELANARRKLTRLENNNKRVLRKYVQGVLTNPDLKSEQKLARLKKLEGISSKKAEAIIKKFPKGMGKEDKITHVTRIGDKTYEKMQTSQIKGIIPEDKLTRQLKEVAEEVTQLETKLTHLTDDIAQLTSKTAVQVFEEEAFDKAHKRTVKKIIEKISARQGLKVVGRIALKVIPFVNVVMTAWDIIEIGLLLYKNIGNYATGGDQGSMIPPDREKKYQPEDKAPVGISPTVMEQINTAPDPVQRIWSSITHQGAPGNLSDTEAQRFLQIVPKNISEEQADEVIAAMLSEETESLSVALTKLQKIIAALQGTTEDTEVGEQDHLKSRQNTVQRSGGVQQSKEYQSPVSGKHITKDAKEVRYNGKVGNANAGILTIDNLSKAHLKMEDEKVTLQVTAYDYSGNSYTVTNNEVKIVEIAYYNSKLDEDVVSEAAATHQRVGYEILDGVQFDFPAPSQDGALVTGRIISGYFKLK